VNIIKLRLLFLILITAIGVFGCKPSNDKLSTSINDQHIILFSSLPLEYARLKKVTHGLCNFESLKSLGNDNFLLTGWAIPSEVETQASSTIIVRIKSSPHESFGLPRRISRQDVADHFKNPKLLASGFEAIIRKEDLPLNSCINVYQVLRGQMIECANSLHVDFQKIESCIK
jgi:hypothetical protein